MAKLEATAKEGGSRVYRVTKCDRGAGMMNVLTDAFLRHGNGTYRLSFRAAAKADAAVPLAAVFLSNEAEFVSRFEIPADGAWHDFEAEIALSFDPAVTELVSLHLRAGIPADELRFKDLSLRKVPPPRPPAAAAKDGAAAAAAVPRLSGCMLPERPTTEEDLDTLASWGATMARFQIVRNFLAIDDNQDLDDYFAWLDARLDNLEDVLRWAAARGLKICVDLHVVPGGRRAPDREMNMLHDDRWADAFVDAWRRIASRVKGHPALYGYDLVNEPCQRTFAANGYRELQLRAARAVREIDPATPIVFESNLNASASAYPYLEPLPVDNAVYSVHFYAPNYFCFQGVGARPMRENGAPIVWPDPARGWDKEWLRGVLKPVREFQLAFGARIYVGEFSAAAWAPGADAWLRDCIDLFEEYGWDWTYHAFREWPGWSVEHEGSDAEHLVPSADNPRKRVLLDGFRRKP